MVDTVQARGIAGAATVAVGALAIWSFFAAPERERDLPSLLR